MNGAKPLATPTPAHCHLDLRKQAAVKVVLKIQQFSFKKMYLKESPAEHRSFRFGLNVLTSFVKSPSLLFVEIGASYGGGLLSTVA